MELTKRNAQKILKIDKEYKELFEKNPEICKKIIRLHKEIEWWEITSYCNEWKDILKLAKKKINNK